VTRIALLSSEPLRPRMAGIGIRYAELARRLPRPGIEVAVITPGDPEAARAVPGMPADVRRFVRGGLRGLVADCDAAVAQGQLANDLVLEVPELPVAIDLFDPWLVENLHYVKQLGRQIRAVLEQGKPASFGELMHEHWERKRKRSAGMSNPKIDEWYERGRQAGALGGKLVGAGGGGFLMFYAPEPQRVRAAMADAKLEEVRFRFDFDGTRVVFS